MANLVTRGLGGNGANMVTSGLGGTVSAVLKLCRRALQLTRQVEISLGR